MIKYFDTHNNIHTGIDVAFTQESYTTNGETGAINVCAEIVSGTIERPVTFEFQSENVGTACKFCIVHA